MTSLLWFRDDLRLSDNPALAAVAKQGGPLVCLYVLDEVSAGLRPFGAASRWWLYFSLASLAADLGRKGQRLVVRRGPAARIIPAMVRSAKADRVFWNRRYGPAAAIDRAIETNLRRTGVSAETFQANLLFEPDTIRTDSDKPFRVHAAFWRHARAGDEPRRPLPMPKRLPPPVAGIDGDLLDTLGLLPTAPDWAGGIRDTWQPGEAGAAARLNAFLGGRPAFRARGLGEPDGTTTARLSPHLRFGEVSPFQVWHAVGGTGRRLRAGAAGFRAELGWREFAWYVLDAFPDMHRRNFRPAFDRLPLEEPYEDEMWAWRRGRTGYPIIDAGMRQLWQTGWMDDRVRTIAASFLAKHLLVDWRIGEEWFWDTLVDADPAGNPFNWQRAAGTGADAEPFSRVLNPAAQGAKADPEGAYVRRYVPELSHLPDRFIHRPWRASEKMLARAGIVLGDTYPLPVVDHSAARARALNAFAQIGLKAERRNLEGRAASQ